SRADPAGRARRQQVAPEGGDGASPSGLRARPARARGRARPLGAGRPAPPRDGALSSDLRLFRRRRPARDARRQGPAEPGRRRAAAPVPPRGGGAAARDRAGACGRPGTEERVSLTLADVDLTNPDFFAAGPPHEAFRLLRRESPVHLHRDPAGDPFWVITRYKDIWDVSVDQKTFSSARRGTILRKWTEEEAEANATMMLNMDPPRHTKYRRLVNMGFSAKMTNRLETHIREMAKGIVDRIAARGSCDFVTDVAAELPLQVIVEMMGVPIDDRHKIFEWSNIMIGSDDPELSGSVEAPKVAAFQMYAYAQELADKRRAEPKDDLVSVLLEAEVEGEKLSAVDFNSFFLLLLVAGNETTRNTISGGMLALLENPAQRDRLLADPSLIDSAVEEMVRWVSPVMYFVRTAMRDVEFRGRQIRENQRV